MAKRLAAVGPMKVHVINHTRKGIVIHKFGCADVEKDIRRRYEINSDWPIDVPANVDAATAVVADLNDGFGWTPDDDEPAPWSVGDVRVMPCVK